MNEIKELWKNEVHEECGVFGVYNCPNAEGLAYYGIHSLQHRGQEGCGIVVSNGNTFRLVKGEGLVSEVFKKDVLKSLDGIHAIGHVRYATSGGGGLENVQPFLFRHYSGDFALAHNGNLVNSHEIKYLLESQGSIFQSTSDSEILAHLIKKDKNITRIEAIKDALRIIAGGFAFIIMTADKMYACRDRYGLRPLSLAKLNHGYVLASETCAFDMIGAEFIRDLEPGEIVTISEQGIESCKYSEECSHHICAMEYVYFSRPDSVIEGMNVHSYRKLSGKKLAIAAPVDADIVIGVPDSSLSAAVGYSEATGIPYETGLLKNKYVGRTFIQPSQELRERVVRMKLSVIKSVVNGKRLVLIDDSIVRGTTSMRIVSMLKDAGAKEVHVRIASPQITHPCFYGVDMSTYEELISARLNCDELCKEIKADSLAFLPMKDLFDIGNRKELCVACFSGKYPTPIYQSLKEANKDGKC